MRLRSPLVLAVLAALLSTLLVQAPANAAMRPAKFERIVENRLPGASMQHSAKARCMDRVIGNRMRGVRPAHLRNRCHVGVVRIVKSSARRARSRCAGSCSARVAPRSAACCASGPPISP